MGMSITLHKDPFLSIFQLLVTVSGLTPNVSDWQLRSSTEIDGSYHGYLMQKKNLKQYPPSPTYTAYPL